MTIRAGYAEACNNLSLREYGKDGLQGGSPDGSVWLKKRAIINRAPIADVQNMRTLSEGISQQRFLCLSRESDGAIAPIRGEEASNLPPRETADVRPMLIVEFYIVAATYFYYVGLEEPMLQGFEPIWTRMQLEAGYCPVSRTIFIISVRVVRSPMERLNEISQTELDHADQHVA